MSSRRQRELAVALDTATREDFFKLYRKLENLDLVFKIGLKILPRLELGDWKTFAGKKIFVDAKLHDIPTQVADAVAAYGDLGATYLTVHLSGGHRMLENAHRTAEKYKITLLGVSALTSLSSNDLKEIGFAQDSATTVDGLITLGLRSGLDSFVMSPHELTLKTKHPQIFCVTPGISLENGNNASDQARTANLDEALRLGSDMPVIGRAITQSSNPENSAAGALQLVRSA